MDIQVSWELPESAALLAMTLHERFREHNAPTGTSCDQVLSSLTLQSISQQIKKKKTFFVEVTQQGKYIKGDEEFPAHDNLWS